MKTFIKLYFRLQEYQIRSKCYRNKQNKIFYYFSTIYFKVKSDGGGQLSLFVVLLVIFNVRIIIIRMFNRLKNYVHFSRYK
jgi:hypothetical protein